MSNQFNKTLNTNIGTTETTVYSTGATTRATVIGMNIANVTDYDTVVVNIYVIDENSTQAHYVRGLSISPNSTAKIITQGEKLILPETAGIRIVSDTEDSIDSVISYVEIS
jgi:hypothetical protein